MTARLLRAAFAVLAVLSLGLPTLPAARAANATEFTIVPTTARWQARTKAQVVGYRFGTDKLFDGVLVFNGGDSTLVEVQLGCILEATLPGDSAPTRVGLLTSEPVTVSFNPKELGVDTSVPWTAQGIIAILIGLFQDAGAVDVTARVRIVSAKWADGRRFSNRLSRGFRERPNAELDAAYSLVTEAELTEALGADLPPAAPAADGALHICRSIPDWICAVSTFTGECVGSGRCPTGLTCSSKCVRVVLPNP